MPATAIEQGELTCQRPSIYRQRLHANGPHGAKSSRREAGKQYELQYTVGSSPMPGTSVTLP